QEHEERHLDERARQRDDKHDGKEGLHRPQEIGVERAEMDGRTLDLRRGEGIDQPFEPTGHQRAWTLPACLAGLIAGSSTRDSAYRHRRLRPLFTWNVVEDRFWGPSIRPR